MVRATLGLDPRLRTFGALSGVHTTNFPLSKHGQSGSRADIHLGRCRPGEPEERSAITPAPAVSPRPRLPIPYPCLFEPTSEETLRTWGHDLGGYETWWRSGRDSNSRTGYARYGISSAAPSTRLGDRSAASRFYRPSRRPERRPLPEGRPSRLSAALITERWVRA